MQLDYHTMESPIGPIHIAAHLKKLIAVDFGRDQDRFLPLLTRRFGSEPDLVPKDDPAGARSALARYFDGDLAAIHSMPTDTGGTTFQQSVWSALRHIPPGKTLTYGALAAALGDANASRAVGLANGRNPISIVIPCHRVIGKNGKLTGYAGGVERKRWLLEHEGALMGSPPDLFD